MRFGYSGIIRISYYEYLEKEGNPLYLQGKNSTTYVNKM
ncbi:hypothetical protein SAMN05216316_1579 [Nitrosovibrio sp. Nv6]|nr:hypothetical protein SAMN05216316_1579 [Nitrosovibrio sp. Nv6]